MLDHSRRRTTPLFPLTGDHNASIAGGSPPFSKRSNFAVRATNSLIEHFVSSPILFTVGPLIVVRFGMLTGIALGAGTMTLLLAAALAGPPGSYSFFRTFVYGLPLVIVVGSIVFYWPVRAQRIGASPRELGSPSFCFYGGLAGAMLLGAYLVRRQREDFLSLADFIVIFLAAFHGASRLACLNYGCCFGRPKENDRGLRVRYLHPAAKVNRLGEPPGIIRHPVQLYELFGGVLLSAVLAVIYALVPWKGAVLAAYLGGYGAMRFVLESWRDLKEENSCWRGRSIWQWVSISVALCSIIVLTEGGREVRTLEFRWFPQGGWHTVTEAAVAAAWSFIVLAVCYGFHFREVGCWIPRRTRPSTSRI